MRRILIERVRGGSEPQQHFMGVRRKLLSILFLLPLLGWMLPASHSQNIQGFPTGSLWIFGKLVDTNNPVFNLSQLVAYWDMNETSGAGFVVDGGATRMDVTCHGWNAVPYNPAFINSSDVGLISNALACPFPTVNGLGVSANMDISPTGLTPFSFQLWMLFLGTDRSGNTVAGEWGGSSNQWRLTYQGTIPGFEWDCINTNGLNVPLNSAGTNLVNGNWYHVVLTFDGSIRTLYVNTIPKSDTNTTRVCRGFGGGLKFGNDAGGVQEPAIRIDECGYWNIALSAQQVTNLFNNGAGLMRGPGPCACHKLSAPYINYAGGLVSIVNSTPFYNSVFLTVDGSLPDSTQSHGGISTATYNNNSPPHGTFTYDATFAIPWGPTNTIIAIGSAGGGCNRRAFFPDSAYTTNSLPSLGALWTNNVVLNGGTVPGANTQTNIDVFAAGLNNGGISPFVSTICLMATDSLTAARSPQIYVKGSQPWANNNFVAGDLTINGLTGDGSTKFLDTGLVANTVHSATSANLAVYCYTTNSNTSGGMDIASFNVQADLIAANFDSGGLNFFSDLVGSSNGRLTDGLQTNGFYATRRQLNLHQLYFANSSTAFAQIASKTAASDGAPGADSFYVFAENSNGSAAFFSNATISAAEIGGMMQAAVIQSLFNAVQAFRVAEGGGAR